MSNRHVTHPCLHIKSAHDAHVVFEAVRLGHLPMIRRRLTGTERSELSSGAVFVWEEAAYKGGLERWTDGRKWSASRMREPFLFYEEKYIRNPELKGPRRSGPVSHDDDSNPRPPKYPRHANAELREAPPDGLTKQTYSAWVTLPVDPHNGSAGVYRKKWHLTAYFSSSMFARLPSVLDDPLLRQIQVPPHMYETGKGLMRKAPSSSAAPSKPGRLPTYRINLSAQEDGSSQDDDDGMMDEPYHQSHHYQQASSHYQHRSSHQPPYDPSPSPRSFQGSPSSTTSSPPMQHVPIQDRYAASHHPSYPPTSSSRGGYVPNGLSSPPISPSAYPYAQLPISSSVSRSQRRPSVMTNASTSTSSHARSGDRDPSYPSPRSDTLSPVEAYSRPPFRHSHSYSGSSSNSTAATASSFHQMSAHVGRSAEDQKALGAFRLAF